MNNRLKIGQEVLIRGYVDEIRKDTIIIRNDGGYFGTVQEEISVKQEPKRGKWIYDGDCIICSKCLNAFGWASINMASNFCPNCGADMTESEEE